VTIFARTKRVRYLGPSFATHGQSADLRAGSRHGHRLVAADRLAVELAWRQVRFTARF
jgi:hypothetical protein